MSMSALRGIDEISYLVKQTNACINMHITNMEGVLDSFISFQTNTNTSSSSASDSAKCKEKWQW